MYVARRYSMSVEDVVGNDIDFYREASNWEIGGLGSICSSGVNPSDHFASEKHSSPSPPALQLTLLKSIDPHPYSPKSHMNCSG